ncbi:MULTISPECIES: BCCT family transporter [unclassified Cobetia]|uniref:BCCT family transporter n=1 Tax=unclassified Cobetia TaxID=2609414 RepID=UPI00178CE95E|nr:MULTISPECIES: BCCT family transporter [unclassified Cobetia]MBE2167810.1 BCCT family transporter [Cobetia sp. 2AS1]MDH2446233.1 BCCT family transporter [Cobetia sp. 2AS]
MFGSSIRPLVFWPPFILLFVSVVASLVDLEGFLAVTTNLNNQVLSKFGWLFSITALSMVVACLIAYLSPLGRTRIGGENATRLLSPWRWFSITLCTTLAVGIMFWSTAEPLYHLHSPPTSLDIAANSPEAARFALSTMFLHWSFTPYAIYTVPALIFALMHYNLGKPFSLGTLFVPLLGDRLIGRKGRALDALALFALVCGMASSLGTGAMTLAGGIDRFLGTGSGPLMLGIVTLAIVLCFTASAASGLQKGIARLSAINAKAFFAFLIFVFAFGPTLTILGYGTEAAGEYFTNFMSKNLFTGAFDNDPWPQSWTIFYWANWMAWAPISALFLGKISRGYTVRQFMLINMVAPSLFSIIYVAVFSSTTLKLDMDTTGALNTILSEAGAGSVIYALFDELPMSSLVGGIFLVIAFLSFVTAADSNTDAISQLCSSDSQEALAGNESEDRSKGRLMMKIIWGSTIGAVAWIMTSFVGIDGIKMLSNLGGVPALFIVIGATASLIRLVSIGTAKIGLEHTPSRSYSAEAHQRWQSSQSS